jgi:hypothetical protein
MDESGEAIPTFSTEQKCPARKHAKLCILALDRFCKRLIIKEKVWLVTCIYQVIIMEIEPLRDFPLNRT